MKEPCLQRLLNFFLAVLLFTLPWQTIWITKERFLNGAKWEYGTLGFYATEILLWTCAILFIFWYWQRVKLRITNYELRITRDRLFALACLALISYLLLSTTWALDQSLAFQQALRVMEAFILFFMLLIGPLSWQTGASWFVAGAAMQSILGIGQFLSQSTIAIKWLGLVAHPAWEAGTSVIVNESGRWLRAYGALPHPNVFGGYLVVGLILTTWLYKTYEINRTNGTNKITFLLLTSPLCLQSAALFFTFSRSAWLALATLITGLLVYWIISENQKSKIINHKSFLSPIAISIAVFVLLSIIFLPLVQTRLSGASTHELTSATDRLSGYAEARQLFQHSPWLGVGAGQYTLAAFANNQNRPGWEYQPVHNVPLLILVELGVIGVALAGAVIAMAVILIKQIKSVSDPFLFFIFSFLPILLFDHYLFSTYVGLLLGGAFMALLWRQTRKSPSHLPS